MTALCGGKRISGVFDYPFGSQPRVRRSDGKRDGAGILSKNKLAVAYLKKAGQVTTRYYWATFQFEGV